MRWFVVIVTVVVAAAIVAGFFVMGSPKTERMRQFDDQRVGHLQATQSQVVFFWQQKGTLAASLDELKDPLGGWIAPRDPETGAAYEYRKTANLSFELCAKFSLPTVVVRTGAPQVCPENVGYCGDGSEFYYYEWKHEAGRHCYQRTIDPALYPVREGAPVGAPVPAKPRVIY